MMVNSVLKIFKISIRSIYLKFKKALSFNVSKKNLLQRYPNNTLLVRVENKDECGNNQQIIYENGELLLKQKFSGVVYINKSIFEVYSGFGENEKTGILRVGEKVDWNAETPRQKMNKAYEAFDVKLNTRIAELSDSCFCSYPRILDYIENRYSEDNQYLQSNLQKLCLNFQHHSYDRNTGVETLTLLCSQCQSIFESKFRERSAIKLVLLQKGNFNQIGKDVEEYAPCYLNPLFDGLFCRESYMHREKLYKSDLLTLMNYLFEKK